MVYSGRTYGPACAVSGDSPPSLQLLYIQRDPVPRRPQEYNAGDGAERHLLFRTIGYSSQYDVCIIQTPILFLPILILGTVQVVLFYNTY